MGGSDDGDSAITMMSGVTIGKESIASKRLTQDNTTNKGTNYKKQCTYNISKQCDLRNEELHECKGDGCINLLHTRCLTEIMEANNLEVGTTHWCLGCLKIESKGQLDFTKEPEQTPNTPH
eukprot:271822-Ditylum_brightwellii.AAC.1